MQAGSNAALLENGNLAVRTPLREPGVCYDNVHDIRQVCEIVGWDLDCRQVEPGHLEVAVTSRKVGRVLGMFKQTDRCVELLGSPPDDHLTLIIPAADHEFWANGFSVEKDHALLVCPGARLHLIARATAFYLVHIPFSVLPEFAQASAAEHLVVCREGAVSVRLTNEGFASLSHLANSIFVDDYAADDVQDALSISAGGVIRQAIEQQRHVDVSRSESWRTISRARKYIEANLHRPIRMRQVSDYAAASVSKLERTFQRELRVTPSRYILARRLHAVNRELGSVIAGDIKVSDLAMQYGFRHLGRFSAAYRSHFGELPSQTLQANGH